MSATETKVTPPVKLLTCSVCRQGHPGTSYSGKQKKLKGKRKCNDCVAFNQLNLEAKEKSAKKVKGPQLAVLDAKGNASVKQANAEAIRKAQLSDKGAKTLLPEADKYDTLLKWLGQGGARFPALQLKYYTTDYRGVHANRRIDPEQIILQVPHKLIMTTDKAKASAIGQAIQNSHGIVRSSHSWLAAMLLQEKYDPTSYWKPYLDTLPAHYRNMPIFFDDDELKELQG